MYQCVADQVHTYTHTHTMAGPLHPLTSKKFALADLSGGRGTRFSSKDVVFLGDDDDDDSWKGS